MAKPRDEGLCDPVTVDATLDRDSDLTQRAPVTVDPTLDLASDSTQRAPATVDAALDSTQRDLVTGDDAIGSTQRGFATADDSLELTQRGSLAVEDSLDLTQRGPVTVDEALDLAFGLAQRGPAHGPNPRVGCVLLAPDGQVIGQGWHRGAGTPHAEVAALNQAQAANLPTTGATAVVTLEPCHHWGLTPPCTQALTAAGIKRVVYALADPNPTAAGGAVALAEAGIEVIGPVAERRAIDLNWAWFHALSWGRPVVTWKLATTLDGRIAALDGSSQWITSAAARRHAHANRQEVDAIAIGTGTLYADDPALTARVDATVEAALAPDQPLRVVLGDRPIPAQARLHGPGGPVIALPGHDPAQVLAALAERQVRHLLIEGGATVAAAFLAADLVDAIDAYIAPIILGDGTSAVAPFGVTTLADAPRWQIVETAQLGSDIFTRLRRTTAPEQSFTPTLGGSS